MSGNQPLNLFLSDPEGLVEKTRSYLRESYFADERPWIVAFSGGKDSTLVLQLVYDMLLELDGKAKKPVYVVASDTGVEPPNISDYLKEALQRIEKHAKAKRIALKVEMVRPRTDESFWAKLIGKGYPSPTRWFRWCTKNMKIQPTRRFVEQVVQQHGSVILLLGTRRSESSGRGQRMDARTYTERGLNPHHEIPDALVSVPISEWTTDQVWNYLLHNDPPPWGGTHDFMMDLYRQAGGGECPLIMDLETAPCGGSRFGCWTCTVVKDDKSMNGFIQSGEQWMEPLKHFRDWLKQLREDARFRMPLRRDGSKGPGPFTPKARQLVLKKLLELELEMGIRLISDDEIEFVQFQWTKEFDFDETAIRLALQYGREVGDMADLALPAQERAILDALTDEHRLPKDLVKRLLYLVYTKYGSLEIHGAKANLEREVRETIDKYVTYQTDAGLDDDI